MASFRKLLVSNRNYRYTWFGQIVSEVGDHFNNVAVFSLALAHAKSSFVVTGVMLARAIPAVLAGPLAGVTLDRLDRKKVMIASDLIRGVLAIGFVWSIYDKSNWSLYAFSALLMFASPFFTSGRSAILPVIANRDELHTANSLMQTTQSMTLIIGAFAAGISVTQFGYTGAFVFNSLSFLVSAFCISRLRVPEGFRPRHRERNQTEAVRPWHEYREGLRYMKSSPLILGLALLGMGWATGGGAAQILFSIFGEIVFLRGPAGIGQIWGCAGIGLLCGGGVAYVIGKRLRFPVYKNVIVLCYIVHGGAYVVFSQMGSFAWACLFIGISRAGIAVSSVLNNSQLLRHVPDQFRGRVFATMESMIWATMMLSMLAAGVGAQYYNPRTVAACAGIFGLLTAVCWAWANWSGRLPEPPVTLPASEAEVALHGG